MKKSLLTIGSALLLSGLLAGCTLAQWGGAFGSQGVSADQSTIEQVEGKIDNNVDMSWKVRFTKVAQEQAAVRIQPVVVPSTTVTTAPSTTVTTSPSTTVVPSTTVTTAPSTTVTTPPSTTVEAPTTTVETTTTRPEIVADPSVLTDEQLARLRQCEATGNYRAVGGGGLYRGAYQFSISTWNSVAGRHYSQLVGVDPIVASPAEQDAMARALFAEQGRRPWPHCGKRL